MLTKLQALELAREWVDRFRGEYPCWDCGDGESSKVVRELETQIILEKAKARDARLNASRNG